MIISCDHLNKSYGEREILRDASLQIEENQKCALVGVNGVGKTTLLKMIMGEEDTDGGLITKNKEKTIGYLPQQLGYHSDKTIYEELYQVRKDIIDEEAELHRLETLISQVSSEDSKTQDSSSELTYNAQSNSESSSLLEKYHRLQTDFEHKEGYAYPSQVMGVINGLGFGNDKDQIINTLSGGQKTRVALGKLLLLKPDLLILDEPTNHLDISSVEWLEGYLNTYPGAVLIVSHDRYFLDRFTDHVWELDNGNLLSFKGNYTDYTSQKELLVITRNHEYEKQQAMIKHQEQVIKKLKQFNREKSIKRAESREKMLDKIDRIEKPTDETKAMRITLEPSVISGNDVLTVASLSKSYDDNTLFSDASFEVKRGEKLAIIGDNGTGKTTLLRMINNMVTADSGDITLGTNVNIGYYDQEHGILNDDKTIFEDIQDEYPTLDNTKIRNTLAAFLFTGDDVFKKISSLSGGEKGRVSLAKLMLSGANLLLLDEPTNHLDMVSREILESALNLYEGTVICVSHDRYFIDRTATRILDLVDGSFHDYKGNYTYYLEKCSERNLSENKSSSGSASVQNFGNTSKNNSSSTSSSESNITAESSSKADWLADKERQAEKRRLERSYAEVEARIETLENDLSSIDEQLSDPKVGTDLPLLTELSNKRAEVESELESAMEQWEELDGRLSEFTS